MTWGPGETVRKRAANLPCMRCVTGNTNPSFCVRRERVVAEVKDAPAIQAIILRKQLAELDNGHGPGSVIGDDCCGICRDVKALVRPWSRIMPEFPNLVAAYGLCRGDRSGDIEMEWRYTKKGSPGTHTRRQQRSGAFRRRRDMLRCQPLRPPVHVLCQCLELPISCQKWLSYVDYSAHGNVLAYGLNSLVHREEAAVGIYVGILRI
jgi:hypothetical protein